MRFASIVVIVLLVFLGIFSIAMTVIFCVYGSVPDSLVAAVFGVGAAEFVSLAAKRIFEDRKDEES